MMRPGVPDVHITDSQDSEMAGYRPLAGQAVAALILGLLAPLALVDTVLWAIPGLGVLFAWWALRRIRKNSPAMTGRKMAVAGLLLSLLFLAIAPSNWFFYRHWVRAEARQFTAIWLRHLNQNEPQKAFQLMQPPLSREPLDEKLWNVYRDNRRLREGLENFVSRSDIRTLLELGPKAQIRYYDAAGQLTEDAKDTVGQFYAVTYEEDEKKSFFVRIEATRYRIPGNGRAAWRITQFEAPIRLDGLE